jgi:protease-4
VANRSALRIVFGLLFLATLVSAAGMLILYLSVGGEPRVALRSTLVLEPAGDLPELLPELLVPFAETERLTVRGYAELLRKAKSDSRIARVLLKPGSLDSPFWGKVQELREAIVDFQSGGKPVHVFLEYAGNREYYLASAASKIYLLPTSTLDLTGVATYEVFLRGTFDWIGAYPDFLHVGQYKTAVNQYMEKTFTPPHREMSESLTRDQYEQLVSAVADGRGKPEADVRAMVDRGPLLADEALKLGLVDELGYEDELDDFDAAFKNSKEVEVREYAGVSWSAAGLRRGPRIALINAVGVIVSGESGFSPVDGPVLGSADIVEHIREARASGAKAIVVRIDSPGGSSIASDVIWRELEITRKTMPVVASMSDLAASGGYYIALGSDAIVAQPGTLTGSIGVYTGKFVTGGAFDKLGMNIEATSQGQRAEIDSPDRRFTPDERARILESMQATYDEFVERAAAARQMPPEKVDQVAQGRVWTGRQAKSVGLVDQLGGLYTAIALAKERARIPAEDEVELVVYPRQRSFYELLTEQFQSPLGGAGARQGSADALVSLLGSRDRRLLAALLAPSRLFRPGELLKHMPFVFIR